MTSVLIAQPSNGWLAPWPQVFEIARMAPPETWVLVGGLMVQAHVMSSGLAVTRVTEDVDVLSRAEVVGHGYASLAAQLQQHGYVFDESPRYAYRFRRGAEIVDLMGPDHNRPPLRFRQRAVFPVTAGTQALSRTIVAEFETETDNVSVSLPSLKAALILKSAAGSADPRDRDRHLLDAISLLACVRDVGTIVDDLKGSDAKRLRGVLSGLREREILFGQVPDDTAALARVVFAELEHELR